MKQLCWLLTLGVVFSVPLTGCQKDSAGRERPSKTRSLNRHIRHVQVEQEALLKEYGIALDSGESQAFAAAVYDWRSKSVQEHTAIRARLRRIEKSCKEIIEAADEPSLRGKVNVKAYVTALDNTKAYLKSLEDHEKGREKKVIDDKLKQVEELERMISPPDKDDD